MFKIDFLFFISEKIFWRRNMQQNGDQWNDGLWFIWCMLLLCYVTCYIFPKYLYCTFSYGLLLISNLFLYPTKIKLFQSYWSIFIQVGVVPMDESKVVMKGRLGPGMMISVDLTSGQVCTPIFFFFFCIVHLNSTLGPQHNHCPFQV